MPSLQDLARLFLSLSGSREQWEAVVGSVFSAASINGAGALSGPAAPEPSAAPSACSTVCLRVVLLRVWFLRLVLPLRPVRLVDMSVLGSPHTLNGAAGARLAGRGPNQVRSVAGVGLLPLVTLSVQLVRPPPLRPHLWMQAYRLV